MTFIAPIWVLGQGKEGPVIGWIVYYLKTVGHICQVLAFIVRFSSGTCVSRCHIWR